MLMFGMENENHIQGSHHIRFRFVWRVGLAEHHVQKVGCIWQIRTRIDHGLADGLFITGYSPPITPPISNWYIATFHGDTHTGLDINLNKPPYGDVELNRFAGELLRVGGCGGFSAGRSAHWV